MDKQVEKQSVETTESVTSEKTMKRGTIIQAVKAIAVLVCICLVCGVLLALCNDIFFISDAERERRAEAKINAALKEVYPDLENPVTMSINKDYKTNAAYGSIQKVVKSADGAYVIAAEGIGGYGGSIVVLVAINKDAKIVAWQVSDGGGETYLDDVKQHKDWYVGEQISTDIELLRHSGATYTSTALNNAIKMASYYAMNVLNLGENPEADAKKAIAEVLADTPYADYELVTNLDANYRADSAVTYTVEGENVTASLSYYFTGSKEGEQDIAAYAFIVGDEIKVVVAKDNVSHADRLNGILKTSENIDDAIVNSVKNRSYLEYFMQKIYKDFKFANSNINEQYVVNGTAGVVNSVYNSTDGAVIIQSTGNGGYMGGTVTVNVVILNGEIKGWSIVSNVGQTWMKEITSKWDEWQGHNPVKTWFVGSSINDVQEVGVALGTGATRAEDAIRNAVNTACYYAKNTTEQGGGN